MLSTQGQSGAQDLFPASFILHGSIDGRAVYRSLTENPKGIVSVKLCPNRFGVWGTWAAELHFGQQPRRGSSAVKPVGLTAIQFLRGASWRRVGAFCLGTVPWQERIEIRGSLTTGYGAGLQEFGQPEPGIDSPHLQRG